MREIISLHSGQCGNHIGHKFWTSVSQEHNLNPNGGFEGDDPVRVQRLPVFYTESATGRYVPRAILFDLEPGSLNAVRTDEWGSLYHPESFIFGRDGAGNNWAKGYKGEGEILAEFIIDRVRKLTEMCECFMGFKYFHSMGGGTGSGLTSLLSVKLKNEFADRISTSYSIYPSQIVSDVVVEPYNTVLTHQRLIENVDQCVCIENEALFRICSEKLLIDDPNYNDLNRLVGYLACGITSSLRFPGQLNVDLRKVAVNLIPFPRLHFYCGSFAPIISLNADDYIQHSVAALTQQAFDHNHMMTTLGPGAKYISCSVTYRGDIPSQEVDIQTLRIQQQYSESFLKWVPNAIKTGIVNIPQVGFKTSATVFGNNTGIRHVFSKVNDNFEAMFNKNAFVHWYTNAGVEEQEFSEASANMMDLVREYERWTEDEDDEDDEE